ncbi:MAG: 3-hydroxyacyl-ACP dehydratase FabZ family protein [Pirellulales bacterium]
MRWFWLDRFTEFVAGARATGVKAVALSEEHLHDHWPYYPVMPNTLIAEGMAQTGGLLVSEIYRFSELVVLAKFSKIAFHGLVRPGEVITYRANVDQAKDAGASVTVTAQVGERPQAEAEIFFARLAADAPDLPQGTRLFDPQHLLHWLKLVGVFEIGTRPDGTLLKIEDYSFG